MGWIIERRQGSGQLRYTACYRDVRGRVQSAGTFGRERDAERAWQRAEVRQAEGRLADPRRGRQLFERYVADVWLPNHVMEITTRQRYDSCLNKYLLPWFGKMRMIDILPSDVREWIRHQDDLGINPATIKKNMSVLSSIFTTALTDRVTFLHPCQGVKTPTSPKRLLDVITPAQFDVIYGALTHSTYQLLVELDIETGCRWGELTELRPRDLHVPTGVLTINRAVIEVSPKFHPTGGRFLVKDYPKDKEHRRLRVREEIRIKLQEYIKEHGLGPNDLLFQFEQQSGPRQIVSIVEDLDDLGLTEPNEKGRQYTHGTTTAYSLGRCRCRNCKSACAAYRAKRRANGRDQPRGVRRVDTDGHIPRSWFRTQVWQPALRAASIKNVTVRDLRHAHASWLLAGGADLAVVKERLGHASIVTTQRYLHTLPNADETALGALDRIRRRAG